jgi:hypothetical protein
VGGQEKKKGVECVFCGEALETWKRGDSKFCSSKCANKAYRALRRCVRCKLAHPSVGHPDFVCVPCVTHEKIVVEKLQFHTVVKWMNEHHVCFYCGEWATEREHVVPQHTLYPTWVVPSCRECNAFAGGSLFDSVLDKLLWVRERRVARYSKLLAMPEWTWDEIDELGKNLRSKIAAAQAARDIVKSQVTWNPLALRDLVGG